MNNSFLVLGNQFFRKKQYAHAISQYVYALINNIELSEIIAHNITQARIKYLYARNNAKKKRIAICCSNYSDYTAYRTYLLAKIYQEFNKVEIIDSLPTKLNRSTWLPIRNLNIPTHSFLVNEESETFIQALHIVSNNPYDILHLSNLTYTNILFGILYELIWNTTVYLDINELILENTKTMSIDKYIKLNGSLPSFNASNENAWSQILPKLIHKFDILTVANADLQKRYGGIILSNSTQLININFSKKNSQLTQLIPFFSKNNLLNKLICLIDSHTVVNKKPKNKEKKPQIKHFERFCKKSITPSLKNMIPAMTCNIFDINIKEHKNFQLTQTQVAIIANQYQIFEHSIKSINYNCALQLQDNFTPSKPTAIIPIRDCLNIINTCLNAMEKSNTLKVINVLVVDDRSREDIKSIVLKYKVSYLRVDYDSSFNFSMLCNIGAKICMDAHNQLVIMWNADLFIANAQYLITALDKHTQHKAAISGTKLLYPPLEFSISEAPDTQNIKRHFPHMLGKWRESIQFGGSAWIKTPDSPIAISPIHKNRFKAKENKDANKDRKTQFVTGAFQIINLNVFKKIGGYNPSLTKSFQDVDICLHALEAGYDIWYFGKDIQLYHDESPSFEKHKNKSDHPYSSDHFIYALLWNK